MSATYEQAHVHAVYDVVAQDFSRTRHTKWPFVHRFVSSLPTGSVVLDAGCGNGKYLSSASILTPRKVEFDSGAWPAGKEPRALEAKMGVVDGNGNGNGKAKAKGKGKEFSIERVEENDGPGRLLSVGLDMCFPLLQIAAGRGHQVVRGDCFDLGCWRAGSFDHAISIATIHHFATDARRMEAVKQLIKVVTPPSPSASTSSPPPPSKILISVWALEQDPSLVGVGSARRGKKGAVRAVGIPGEGDFAAPTEVDDDDDNEYEQDVFVPWQLQAPKIAKPVTQKPVKKPFVWIGPPPPPASTTDELASRADVARPPPSEPSIAPQLYIPTTEPELAPPKPTFNRYYHLFRRGELTSLVQLATTELGGVFVPGVLSKDARTNTGQSSWELECSLEGGEERWERENWVVEINVRWLRS